jgi:plasmid stabilization system protein ParE
MGTEAKHLRVEYSKHIPQILESIWEYTFDRYGMDHAKEYLAFLKTEIAKL